MKRSVAWYSSLPSLWAACCEHEKQAQDNYRKTGVLNVS